MLQRLASPSALGRSTAALAPSMGSRTSPGAAFTARGHSVAIGPAAIKAGARADAPDGAVHLRPLERLGRRGLASEACEEPDPLAQLAQAEAADASLLRLVLCAASVTLALALASSLL